MAAKLIKLNADGSTTATDAPPLRLITGKTAAAPGADADFGSTPDDGAIAIDSARRLLTWRNGSSTSWDLPPGTLLSSQSWTPGSDYSTTSNTQAELDTARRTASFMAPSSQAVLVEFEALVQHGGATSTAAQLWQPMVATSPFTTYAVTDVEHQVYKPQANTDTMQVRIRSMWVVIVVAGTVYRLSMGWRSGVSGTATKIKTDPIRMMVYVLSTP